MIYILQPELTGLNLNLEWAELKVVNKREQRSHTTTTVDTEVFYVIHHFIKYSQFVYCCVSYLLPINHFITVSM
jgi:hypothetical protein